MLRFFSYVLSLFFLVQLCLPMAAAAGESSPELSAQCAILMDGGSGRVLYEKQAYTLRPIASVTKLMTALVAISVCEDISELVTVSPAEAATEGSSLYLKAGEEISVESLLYGLLLESGNDAAAALARHLAGDERLFVDWMNQWAVALGMKNTRFTNPSGLPGEGQFSTAYDVALLAKAVLDQEMLARIVATRSVVRDERSFTNHNKLLWNYEGCIGLKTGYTDEAGRTLASAAQRDGRTLIAVTLKAADDWDDHTALFDYGFSAFQQSALVQGGKGFRGVEVRGALVPLVQVTAHMSVYYPLRSDEQATIEIELPNWVQAPVKAGTIAGAVRFYLEGEQIGHSYLIFTKDVQDNSLQNLGALGFFRNMLSGRQSFTRRYESVLATAVTVSLPAVKKDYYSFAPYR